MTQALRNMEQLTTTFLMQESEKRRMETNKKQQEILMPLRLQAYERMTLFCSRIELGQLMFRLQENQKAKAFRYLLIANIEEEFNHNITQQVYMTDELWKMLQLAKTEAIKILEHVGKEVDPEASAQDFVNAALRYLDKEPQLGFIQAQIGIKKEVQSLF
jgi:hypothetical protein